MAVEHIGQGSWVAMTFDDKDRLIVSDQYGALYRMEVPTIGSGKNISKLEKLKIQTAQPVADSIIQMGYAQMHGGNVWGPNSQEQYGDWLRSSAREDRGNGYRSAEQLQTGLKRLGSLVNGVNKAFSFAV